MNNCSRCGEPLGPRVDGNFQKIGGKEVCDDCYFRAHGAQIEANPIATPGLHGPGVAAHLDASSNAPDTDADLIEPALGGHARGRGSNLDESDI